MKCNIATFLAVVGIVTPATASTPKPSPTQNGLIESCTTFYFATPGDTCSKIVNLYGGFTLSDFYAWNPAVGSDCSNIQAKVYYCVGIPSTFTAMPMSSIPTRTSAGNGIETPMPTQPGMVSNCNAFYFVQSGDWCQAVADKNGITLAQFMTWNPQVGGASCTGLWANVYVCVGVDDPTTITASPSCIASISPPSPTQPGTVCTCKRWHKVVANQYCADIETLYGITAAQFNAWNPQVGASCATLWLGYYVCVGA